MGKVYVMNEYQFSGVSDLSYSVQNEDFRTEIAVLNRLTANSLRVLLIASSGENALSLLTDPRIEMIHALDLSPAQLHLCALRAAAVDQLSRDDHLRLLGADPTYSRAHDSAARLKLYEQVRPALPDSVRAFWDERRETEVAFGIQHVGRNDAVMHDLQDRLRKAGFSPLTSTLVEDDLPRWQSEYRAHFTPDYIRRTLGIASAGLAEKIAGIAAYLGECHFRALQQEGAHSNPYLTTGFLNRYPIEAGDAGLPLYLQEENYLSLRKQGIHHRLLLRQGNVVEFLADGASAFGNYDLISISNIADWMTPEQFSHLIAVARARLNPGGVLLARTATPRTMIVEDMGKSLRVDSDFNRSLSAVERGPWFRIISAGFNA